MTTSELIGLLQDSLQNNGDLEVMSSSDYGDTMHTEQLDPIFDLQTCNPIESAYSRSGLAFPTDHQDEIWIQDQQWPVLVLRSRD